MSEDAQWEYMYTLTRALTSLAGALLPLIDDVKQFARLKPFYDELRTLAALHAEHCRSEPVEAGPSTAELHERIGVLEEHHESRKRDADRPYSVRIIDTRKKQDEKV
jgi:hypothetical protein